MSSPIKRGEYAATFDAAEQLLKVKVSANRKATNFSDVPPQGPAVQVAADYTPSTAAPAQVEKRSRGRPKGSKTSKHPLLDRPKRPLSAYNLFFKDERQKIADQGEVIDDDHPGLLDFDTEDKKKVNSRYRPPVVLARTSSGKLKFADLAKVIGPKWRNVDAEIKKKYEAQASIECAKYKKAMENYNSKVYALEKIDKFKESAVADGNINDRKRVHCDKEKYTSGEMFSPRKLAAVDPRIHNEIYNRRSHPGRHVTNDNRKVSEVNCHQPKEGNGLMFSELRKRYFESILAQQNNGIHAPTGARTNQLQGDGFRPLASFPLSVKSQRTNAAHGLDPNMTLLHENPQVASASVSASGSGSAASFLNATNAASALHHPLSSLNANHQRTGFSNFSSLVSQPPSMQTEGKSDSILKRAMELGAARRLLEEQEQQLEHDMAVEAAVLAAHRNRLVEKRQTQKATQMLQVQHDQQEERYHPQE